MRAVIVVTLLVLLSTAVSALTFAHTDFPGTQPVLDGNIIAFLTLEDSINQDLNGDNDTADRVVLYYHLQTEKTLSTRIEGKNPALFGTVLAFEDTAGILWLHDTETKELNDTTLRGSTPSLFGNTVVFSTSEHAVGSDLSGDGDTNDDVIQHLNLDTGVVKSTHAIGSHPVVLQDSIVFETNERAIDQDLSTDGDQDDVVIRFLHRDTEHVVNTQLTGRSPIGFKNTSIVTQPTQFVLLDLGTTAQTVLPVFGNDPSLYDDMLVYERNGTLFLYRLSTGVEHALGITGTDPSISANALAFIDDNRTVSVLQGDDPDQDSVPDFADNCLDVANANQTDTDKDGVGDACMSVSTILQNTPIAENTTHAALTAQVAVEQPEQPPLPSAERSELPDAATRETTRKENNDLTFWFVVAVGLLGIAVLLYFVVPAWLKRRRKSYGF